MKNAWQQSLCLVVASTAGCAHASDERSFSDDVAFLEKHAQVIVLEGDGARVAVVPDYQGRVMTSTPGGGSGQSCGYLHYERIASDEATPRINVFGGEDRLWFGPEGGQFSIFFAPGAPFDLEHWQTPSLIDSDSYPVVPGKSDESRRSEAKFRAEGELINHSGTRFAVAIERTIRVLARDAVETALHVSLPQDVKVVGFESDNRLSNRGSDSWKRDSGLLSIWILGMFKPAAKATVVIPYVPGPGLGPAVNDAYFGEISPSRLSVDEEAIYFRADGRSRGKIGVPRGRANPICGAYDPSRKLLTIVQFTLDSKAKDYVNSMWEIQQDPYAGDVVNAYNDGPPEPGKPALGPFYELESSSPAAALGPGQTMSHVHRTFHFEGTEASLDVIARAVLGIPASAIRRVLP